MWSQSESIYRIATHSTAKAWRNRIARYRIVGSECNVCKKRFFPPRTVCPGCHSFDLEAVEFSKNGKVVCSAIDHSPLMGHGEEVPKPLAIVALESGPHVIVDIIECEAENVKEGLEVEAVVRKWRRETNGNYMYGFKFRPRGARS